MIPFNVLFGANNEIEYNGRIISRRLIYKELGRSILKFTFISSNSKFNQAIVLFTDEFVGKISVLEVEQDFQKTTFKKMNIWQATAPKTFTIEVDLESGLLDICNGSDPIGTRQICHSLSFGCAMIIEKGCNDDYIFYCNDHENDDDFDDLIFKMEISRGC